MLDRFKSWAGGALESIKSAGKKIVVPVLTGGVVGTLFVGGASDALAVPAAAPTPADFSVIYGVIDPVTMSYAIATLGGAALVAAFSVGGGFKIGKKAYSWVMGKI